MQALADTAESANLILFAQEPSASLDPAHRAAWLLGILGIIVLAIGAILVIWLCGRMLRRHWQLDQPTPASREASSGYATHRSATQHSATKQGDKPADSPPSDKLP